MPQEHFLSRPFVWPSIFLSLALLAGLLVVGWGIATRNQNNTIGVTGSASMNVASDEAKWTVDVSRTAYQADISSADAQIAHDATAIEQFFKSQNLASSSVTLSTIYTDINYTQMKQGTNEPTSYKVHETVTIQTSSVATIDTLSRDLSALNKQVSSGTILSPQPPEYYVSSLPQLRVKLLGQAISDARARAVEIAKSGGSSVGALQSASSGVVQVLAPNSTEVEGYGAYDTSTIQKQVMVTAHANFYVK